jgi:hypothetical protein
MQIWLGVVAVTVEDGGNLGMQTPAEAEMEWAIEL